MHISGSKPVYVVFAKTPLVLTGFIQLQESHHSECVGGGGGSLDICFDNIGKCVVKNCRINSAGLQRVDTITTATQILPSNVPHIQADISLKPQKIISTEILLLIHQKMTDAISESYAAFLVYRFKFIVNILSTLSTYLSDDDKIILQKLE